MKINNQMVKNIRPIRNAKYDRQSRNAIGHRKTVEYMIALST